MEKLRQKKYVSCLTPCRLRLLTTIFYYLFSVSNYTPKIASAIKAKRKKKGVGERLKRGDYFISRGQGRPF